MNDTPKIIIVALLFIYNALVLVLPLNGVLGHFLPSLWTWACIFIFSLLYQFIPLVPDILIHILYPIGAFFVYQDFPLWYFIIYIAFMLSVYIRTIIKTINSRRNRDWTNRRYPL